MWLIAISLIVGPMFFSMQSGVTDGEVTGNVASMGEMPCHEDAGTALKIDGEAACPDCISFDTPACECCDYTAPSGFLIATSEPAAIPPRIPPNAHNLIQAMPTLPPENLYRPPIHSA